MGNDKTTKEILKEEMPRKERTPLYNPQALAKGIKKVLNNPKLAKRISSQAYKDVQEYTWDKRTEKILRFLMKI